MAKETSLEVFQQFYDKLVNILPMKDPIFIAQLFSHRLLPDNLKDCVESQTTQALKASCFLDQMIRPSVTTGIGNSFDELLSVMKDSEYQSVNELAELIKASLRDPDCHGSSDSISEPACKKQKSSQIDVCRLKARYCRLLPTSKADWPVHQVTQYIRLALVEKEDVTLGDDHLNELTKLTLQGDVDSILKVKEPLHDLRDIFHYQNKPCPRLILIMGGPGKF